MVISILQVNVVAFDYPSLVEYYVKAIERPLFLYCLERATL